MVSVSIKVCNPAFTIYFLTQSECEVCVLYDTRNSFKNLLYFFEVRLTYSFSATTPPTTLSVIIKFSKQTVVIFNEWDLKVCEISLIWLLIIWYVICQKYISLSLYFGHNVHISLMELYFGYSLKNVLIFLNI